MPIDFAMFAVQPRHGLHDDLFLNPTEAAEFLAGLGLPVAVSTLRKWRCTGGGPVFQSFGRAAKYRVGRLREFVAARLSQERRSTSDHAA